MCVCLPRQQDGSWQTASTESEWWNTANTPPGRERGRVFVRPTQTEFQSSSAAGARGSLCSQGWRPGTEYEAPAMGGLRMSLGEWEWSLKEVIACPPP